MAEENNSWSNPKLIIPLVLIAIAAVVGIPMFLKWKATVATNKNVGSTAAADAAAAAALEASIGLPNGRGLEIIGAARTMFNEVTTSKLYVNSTTCVTALNQAQNDNEMLALQSYYNTTLSNNGRNLKSDVDNHVIGWGTSASDILYYNDLT